MADPYDRNSSIGSQSSTGTIIGYFSNVNDAYRAVSELRAAGFTSDQIGLVIRGDGREQTSSSISGNEPATEGGEDRGFWQEVKDFFSGEDHSNSSDFRNSLSGMELEDDRADYYYRGVGSGGALVSVRANGERGSETRRILERCGADLRDTGFSSEELSSGTTNAGRGAKEVGNEDYRVQLRGEMLQAHKERVSRGEVRLRKEVVSENRSIEVPVTREELVIERTDATGATPTGEIGRDQEIRVPLSEERVTVEKKPVVTGEVKIGKRQVQDKKTVSDTVRHEEARIEKDGDVEVDDATLKDKKRRIA